MRYITGANGFVGTYLLSKTGATPIPHSEITTVQLEPFSRFFFLSSYGNMSHHTDEDAMYQANILDLISVLQKIKHMDFHSFVFMSSSSVKLSRQTTYSRFKRAAEEILLAFMERHNKPILIIRPFSITGVGEQEEHLIPTLIRSCYTGELVNFVPTPTHDFIDVEDVVHGIDELTWHDAKGIFELGTGVSYTNQEVLDIVENITGRKANINLVPSLRDYDNENWVSTNMKARGFGWVPKKSLYQSILGMVDAYKDTIEITKIPY